MSVCPHYCLLLPGSLTPVAAMPVRVRMCVSEYDCMSCMSVNRLMFLLPVPVGVSLLKKPANSPT